MAELSKTVQSIRNLLNPIRDIVIHLHSILIWQKPYHYPSIIFLVTLIFMALWLVEVSVISQICFIGIIITLLDYFLPFINALVAFQKWETEEAKFHNICETIAEKWLNFKSIYKSFLSWKKSNTKLYYTTLLTGLMALAWIGSRVHNLFILYLCTLYIALYPGLSHHGLIEQFLMSIKSKINSFFPQNSKDKLTKKKN